MKTIISLLILCLFAIGQGQTIQAQQTSELATFEFKEIPIPVNSTLKETFDLVFLYKTDVNDLKSWVGRQNEGLNFRFHFEHGIDFEIFANPNPILENSGFGNRDREFPIVLRGNERDGGIVRLTVAENLLIGFLEKEGETWYIEPASKYDQSHQINELVLYRSHEVNNARIGKCLVLPNTVKSLLPKTPSSSSNFRTGGNCLEIATSVDYSMYQAQGYSVSGANNYVIGILNMAEANYSPFNISFNVVDQFVANSGNPWSTTTNANNYISNYNGWASNNINASHDVRVLFSALSLVDGSSSIAGIAYLSGICNSNRSAIVTDNNSSSNVLRVIAAHELGHGFSASHDGTSSNYIMRPSVYALATQFSSASSNSISNWISNHSCFACSAVPSNDDCSNADLVTPCGSTVSGTVDGATASGVSKGQCDNFSSPALLDVWYEFTAVSSTMTVTVNPNLQMDAVLVVYQGSCNNLSEIGCRDQGGGNGASETLNLSNLVPGNTYYIRIYDYGSYAPNDGTFSVQVTGNGPSSPNISGNTTICFGQSTTLTTSGCNSCQVTWSNGSNSSSITVSSPGTYTATYDNGCGTSSSSITVTSSGTLPDPPVISGNTSICQGQSTTLSWTNQCNGCAASWSTGSSSNSITVSNPGTYTLTVSNNCGSNSSSITVTQSPGPNVQVNPPSAVISLGNSVPLSASGAQTYSWSPSAGLNSSSGASVVAIPANSTTYTVTGTDANGCIGSTTVTVTVIGGCTITIAPTNASFNSSGGNGTFNVVVTGNNCADWVVSGVCPWITVSSPTGPVNGPGSVNYQIASNGTNASRSCTLFVGGQPYIISQSGGSTGTANANFFAGQTSGCAPLKIDFISQASCPAGNPVQYLWDFWGANPPASTDPNPTNITYSQIGNYSVRLIIVCGDGSMDTIVHQNYISVPSICVGSKDQQEDLAIQIYPNPSSGEIVISGNLGVAGFMQITVLDMNGRMLRKSKPQFVQGVISEKLDLSELPKAIYYLKVTFRDKCTIKKIAIQ